MADTAYKTFKAAFKRATYLYRMYHGLTNHRQRAMRADWAGNFCRVMHWSKGMASEIDRVDSPDAIVVLKEDSRLNREDFDREILSDMLRASLVMGVSALDAYFHCKVIAHVVKAAKKGPRMPKALRNRAITVAEFVEGKKYTYRMQTVRKALERGLGYESLQRPDKIASALSLIGVKDFWANLADRMGVPQAELKKELLDLVRRRNWIAHEGDLSQSKSARNRSRRIEPKEVRQGLGLIRRTVKRAEEEINAQL